MGHEVAESTVAKYTVRHRLPGNGQRWATFLANHMDTTIACDFFTVASVTFRSLFVFVVLHHGSRRILHVGVTAHPTAEWTAGQLVEALGDEGAPEVDRLLRDRDSTFGEQFQRKAAAIGLAEIVTPKASPWCNGLCERVIGSIRRECTDHIIPLGEHHLTRVLRGDAPVPRQQWSRDGGAVQARPVLVGLHHIDSRAA